MMRSRFDATSSVTRYAWLALWTVLILGHAATAQAGQRMYTGSLIIEAFGNDTTTGTAPPFQSARHVGIPLTGNCNTAPLHLKETLVFTLTPPGGGTRMVTFTVPTYGGAVPQGPMTPPVGCGDATVRAGDPLVGGGTALTTGTPTTSRTTMDPRGFTLPASELVKVKSGASFELYGAYRWEVHFADLRNATGVFGKNGGDGFFQILYQPGGGGGGVPTVRSVRQTPTPGGNQFGGTMRLLGTYGDNEGYYSDAGNHTSVFVFDTWLFKYLGAPGQAIGTFQTGMGPTVMTHTGVTAGYQVKHTVYGYTRTSGGYVTSIINAAVFKWTTGMVTVEANQGTFPTHQALTGYDNRTPMGSGMVQLVTPMLTHWDGFADSSTAGIGILKLDFAPAPEPHEWMMLAGGITMLVLLVYTRRYRS